MVSPETPGNKDEKASLPHNRPPNIFPYRLSHAKRSDFLSQWMQKPFSTKKEATETP